MNDEYFKKQAKLWAETHAKVADGDLERTLFMFAKEVARDVRHKAFDIAQAASQDIMNMRSCE